MASVLPIALFALAGALVGGVYSMHKQGAGRGTLVIMGLLAVVALVGGVLWLLPEN